MIALALLVAAAAIATGEPASGPAGDCVDVSEPRNSFTFSGRLLVGRFPSPSVSAPRDGELALFLELDQPICAYDGGEFANPDFRFDRIHVWGDDEVVPALLRALGHRVTLTGEAYSAHTGHHHAPLVMSVKQVTVR